MAFRVMRNERARAEQKILQKAILFEGINNKKKQQYLNDCGVCVS
jgi:hypothetical protein